MLENHKIFKTEIGGRAVLGVFEVNPCNLGYPNQRKQEAYGNYRLYAVWDLFVHKDGQKDGKSAVNASGKKIGPWNFSRQLQHHRGKSQASYKQGEEGKVYPPALGGAFCLSGRLRHFCAPPVFSSFAF